MRNNTASFPQDDAEPGQGTGETAENSPLPAGAGVPWSYFEFRLDRARSAEFRALQSDDTGVIAAAHALLNAVLPAPPTDEELRAAFALAWHDRPNDETADEPQRNNAEEEEMRELRAAWGRVSDYMPSQKVFFETDEDGSRHWCTVSRHFTGEATVFLSDGCGEGDWMTVFVFAEQDGSVGANVRAPHPLAGCRVASEKSGCDAAGEESVDDASAKSEPVLRLPADAELFVHGEETRGFLARQGAAIADDIRDAMRGGSWRVPAPDDDEEGCE